MTKIKPTHTNLGVCTCNNKILLYASHNDKSNTYCAYTSSDGVNYFHFDDTCILIAEHGKLVPVSDTKNHRITALDGGYFLTFAVKSNNMLWGATSHDALHWYKLKHSLGSGDNAQVLPGYINNENVALVKGGNSLSLYQSADFKTWTLSRVLLPQTDKIISYIVSDIVTHNNTFVILYIKNNPNISYSNMLYALMLDAHDGTPLSQNPRLLWKGSNTISSSKDACIGSVFYKNTLYSYWYTASGSLRVFTHKNLLESLESKSKKPSVPLMYKSYKNPILKPHNKHLWESQAVFNPAAVYDKDKVHLLYRAVGDAGISMLGYATSSDGLHIDFRNPHPVYMPNKPFEGVTASIKKIKNSIYVSGPGWGGCEDPRITKIDSRFYVTYVAFDGFSPPRLALTSISEEDFHNQNWNWTTPVLISAPGIVNKSGAILPEKIKGKYVIFHREYPNIYIDYVDSLDFNGSTYLKKVHAITPRKTSWDSRKVGIGAVPLKTQDGWLTIYNAVDNKDDSRYKIGAMLLDLDNPSKVIARSAGPILEPTEHYENNGLKYGVVYPCGAVILNSQLIVYYGGSDTYVCAATAYVPQFLRLLKQNKRIQMNTTEAETVSFLSAHNNTTVPSFYQKPIYSRI